jgi:transposase-like protein
MAIRYPKEQKDRAVKMVLSHLGEYDSVYKAASVIGPKLNIGTETLRRWVVVAQVDASPAGVEAKAESARVKELERRVRDLTEANEILKAASIFFAGELDPRQRRG